MAIDQRQSKNDTRKRLSEAETLDRSISQLRADIVRQRGPNWLHELRAGIEGRP